MEKEVALVYMVAGMSSRFGGEVKQFARVGPNDETLIEYSLKQALDVGFSKIIFIVGNRTEVKFREMFGDEYIGVPVFYARQGFDFETRNRPWGTVDALCCVKELIDCSFVVCNGDDIYGKSSFEILFNHVQKSEESATIGFKLGNMLSDSCDVNRGIFEVNRDGYIESMVEMFAVNRQNLVEKNLDVDDLCNVNLFAFHPSVLEMLDVKLKSFKERNDGDRDAECLLSTELSKLVESRLMKIKTYFASGKYMGVTGPEDVEIVRKTILSQSD